MTGFISPLQTLKCPECGHTLFYVGRGRHRCTNLDCPVDRAHVVRRGKVYRVVMASTPTEEAQ